MKSPQLRFLIVGNASCFHGADNFAIPPLYMCRHINRSNVSLMSGISFHACISPPLHLAEQHEISVSRGADVTLWNFSPEATSGPVSLTPTVWVAVAVGGRWVVVGLAAHWARGLAHPTTDPALRRGRLQ